LRGKELNTQAAKARAKARVLDRIDSARQTRRQEMNDALCSYREFYSIELCHILRPLRASPQMVHHSLKSLLPFGVAIAAGSTRWPKGARDKATLAAEALLDGEAEEITRKAVELAKAGDTIALRLLGAHPARS
jgi:hypothetical protein